MSFGVSSSAGQFPNRELYLLISAQLRKISNPLTSQYWSQTPYALGPHVIKFSAKPVGSPPATHSALGGPDFLQDEMAVLLQTHDVNFDFLVQLQTNSLTMPIDDATAVWNECESPFRRVESCTSRDRVFFPQRRWLLRKTYRLPLGMRSRSIDLSAVSTGHDSPYINRSLEYIMNELAKFAKSRRA
jgi:hypothetical protein